jgi:hypothetical protein
MVLIGLMKLNGAFWTEIINLVLISQQSDVGSVIMNLIALGVIASVDNIYAASLTNDEVRKSIGDRPPIYIFNEANGSGFVVNVLKTLYQSYYYYYMPLTMIIIVCFNSIQAQ